MLLLANTQGVPLALEWSQFGLGGVVIGAMFWLVWTMGKRQDLQSKLHRDERAEWRGSQEHRDREMTGALTELTRALRGESYLSPMSRPSSDPSASDAA
jgi:hypothetical protein